MGNYEKSQNLLKNGKKIEIFLFLTFQKKYLDIETYFYKKGL